jgi:mannosyl-glycoprotein endo-beta-N-acetylglucosaminidase
VLRLGSAFLVAIFVGALATLLGVSVIPLPYTLVIPSLPTATTSARSSPDDSLHHLPSWVQTRQVAAFWSGPDRQAIEFTDLPAWTFLKVISARADRLQVEYGGDGTTRQAGPGWVAVTDVQPSDPSGSWFQNHRASTLFADSGGRSVSAAVPQWSWMVHLDDTSPGARLHVRVYTNGFGSVLGEGWLPADDLGPTDPPAQSVYTENDKAPPPPYTSHDQFVSAVADAARGIATPGAPVSVTVAQAILESGWGQSLLSREANNYFGIKATGQLGNDGAVWMPTFEIGQTGAYRVLAAFRAYKSLADSVADHDRLFRDVGLYRPALQVVDNPDEFARRIAQAGYATDPSYASKLIDVMHRDDLYRLDAPAEPIQQTA